MPSGSQFALSITLSSEAMASVTSCHLSRPMLENLALNSQEHHSLCKQVVNGYFTQCVPSMNAIIKRMTPIGCVYLALPSAS